MLTTDLIMKVKDVVEILPASKSQITSTVIDSRLVVEGSLFVAFSGEQVDGNAYAASAIASGASSVVLSAKPSEFIVEQAQCAGCGLYMVENPTVFLQRLAALYRKMLDCIVIGVTGSSGKTTTREMVAAVCACKWNTHVTIGNLNNEIGMPLTILAAPLSTEVMVLEMGMSGLGEIALLAKIALPSLAVITNVGVAHLALLGSRESIADAKSEIIAGLCPPTGQFAAIKQTVLLHSSDVYTPYIIEHHGREDVRFMTYEASRDEMPEADITAEVTGFDAGGCPQMNAVLEGGSEIGLTPAYPGIHNALNALAALGIGEILGVPASQGAQALSTLSHVPTHQEVFTRADGGVVIDDTYNANPDSMRLAIDVLTSIETSGRHIAVLGDMGELGPDQDLFHGIIGGYVAGSHVDILICVGPLSLQMYRGALLMGMEPKSLYWYDTVLDACTGLSDVLRSGDAVLVKASHSTGLGTIVKEVLSS